MKTKIRLGETLLSRERITAETLAEALRKQKDLPGVKIGRILIELGIEEDVITEALALQSGLEWIRLSERIIPPDVALRIPPEYARKYRVVPFEAKHGVLRVAVDDPNDLAKLDLISRFLNVNVEPAVASDSDLEIALDRLYGKKGEAAPVLYDRRKRSTTGALPIVGGIREVSKTEPSPDDPAAVRVLDDLLLRAARDGASDIHLEPFENYLRIRLRIDGILHEIGSETVSPKSIAARIKVLSELDPAETRRPQDGRFRVQVENRSLDLRISTIPTAFGEKVVMRILDRERAFLDLEKLGMSGDTLIGFRRAIREPHGFILVTGPTGSGKTTTLYAALSERNSPDLNITTIEDPIEYDLYGVSQIQVHPKIGVTFAKGLRHILRQDPDVILVGEIRDAETAEVAIQSSLTGHLVFSTLHTNDAIGAVARLLDMNVEPFLVADAVTAVLSQRLVRTLCDNCKKSATGVSTETEIAGRILLKNGETFYKSSLAGCQQCRGTGYSGRTGIYELLSITPELSSLIRAKASSERIMEQAKSDGHRSILEDGLAKVRAGVTSMQELRRVLRRGE